MLQSKTKGLTKDVADFIQNYTFENIPQEAIPLIKNAFIDTIGVALAGKDEECSKILLEVVKDEQAKGDSSIWGYSQKTSASLAALVNGTMSHALDFDDVNSKATQAHPSAALVPAIIAAAQEVDASGKDMILAYFVGFEVMAYIGKAITYNHYKIGWHGTATMGVLGCTAAASKLYKLSEEQIEDALGIAVSHMSGSRQNFGTMTKPFHAGNAARSGIFSSKLAQKGFTADRAILEAPLGLFALYLKEGEIKVKDSIGESFEITNTKLSIKQYPCCYGSHRAIDGTKILLQKFKFKPEQIEEIRVIAPKNGFTPLIHKLPQTGLAGKFSVEFPIAVMIYEGKVNVASFNTEEVLRPEIQEMMKKVVREEDESIEIKQSAIEEGHITVRIRLLDGTEFEEQIKMPKGAAEWPLSSDELKEKFLDCVSNSLSDKKAKELLNRLNYLESVESVKEISCF